MRTISLALSWGEGREALFSLLNLALPRRENKCTVSILFVKRAFGHSRSQAWRSWDGVARTEVSCVHPHLGRSACDFRHWLTTQDVQFYPSSYLYVCAVLSMFTGGANVTATRLQNSLPCPAEALAPPNTLPVPPKPFPSARSPSKRPSASVSEFDHVRYLVEVESYIELCWPLCVWIVIFVFW